MKIKQKFNYVILFTILGSLLTIGLTSVVLSKNEKTLTHFEKLEEINDKLSHTIEGFDRAVYYALEFYTIKENSSLSNYNKYFDYTLKNLTPLKELDSENLELINQTETVIIKYNNVFKEFKNLITEVGLDENSGLTGELRKVIHNVEKNVNDRLLNGVLMLRRHEKDFFLRLDEKYISRFNNTVDKIIKSSSTNKQMKNSLLEYKEKFNLIADKLLAVETKRVELYNIFNQITPLEDKYADIVDINLEEARKTLEQSTHNLFYSSTIINFSVSTAIVFLIIILAKAIIKPIMETTNILKEISEGEGDLSKSIEIKRKDEIGELAKYFNLFVLKLNDLIIDIKSLINNVNDEANKISITMEEVVKGGQNHQYDNIKNLVKSLNSVLDNVRNQTASSEETLAGLEEIAASTNNISEYAKNTLKSSKEAVDLGNKGSSSLDAMNSEMNTITHSVNNAESKIDKLVALSSDIENIVTAINSIAEQTNLLALNAAIEAARAGDAGKGFAVVADEIRKLAEQTNGETNKIETLVKNIQKEVTEVKDANNQIEENVEKGLNLSKEIIININNMVEISGKNSDSIGEITTSTEEQVVGTEEITEAVKSITDNSTEIESLSVETTDIANSIADKLTSSLERLDSLRLLTNKLYENVSGFKTK